MSELIAPLTSALSASNPADRRIAEGTIPGDALCSTPSNHKSASWVVNPNVTPSLRANRHQVATVSSSPANHTRLMTLP